MWGVIGRTVPQGKASPAPEAAARLEQPEKGR
jgi:hypothetical protein